MFHPFVSCKVLYNVLYFTVFLILCYSPKKRVEIEARASDVKKNAPMVWYGDADACSKWRLILRFLLKNRGQLFHSKCFIFLVPYKSEFLLDSNDFFLPQKLSGTFPNALLSYIIDLILSIASRSRYKYVSPGIRDRDRDTCTYSKSNFCISKIL